MITTTPDNVQSGTQGFLPLMNPSLFNHHGPDKSQPNPILLRINPYGYILEVCPNTGAWSWNKGNITIHATPGWEGNWQRLPVDLTFWNDEEGQDAAREIKVWEVPWNYNYGVTDYIVIIQSILGTVEALCTFGQE